MAHRNITSRSRRCATRNARATGPCGSNVLRTSSRAIHASQLHQASTLSSTLPPTERCSSALFTSAVPLHARNSCKSPSAPDDSFLCAELGTSSLLKARTVSLPRAYPSLSSKQHQMVAKAHRPLLRRLAPKSRTQLHRDKLRKGRTWTSLAVRLLIRPR